MNALLHWPPPENPAYERERDCLSAWDCERQMNATAAEAEMLWLWASDAEDCGLDEQAARLLDRSEAKWREWARLKDELANLEGGW